MHQYVYRSKIFKHNIIYEHNVWYTYRQQESCGTIPTYHIMM